MERKIEKIKRIMKEENDINKIKILLANEATKLLHGEKISKDSEKTAQDTFKNGGVGKDLPEIKLSKSLLNKGVGILDFLASNNIASSKSDARRIIQNNGIKINDILISDDKLIISIKYFKENNFIKVSSGKKKHFIIRCV